MSETSVSKTLETARLTRGLKCFDCHSHLRGHRQSASLLASARLFSLAGACGCAAWVRITQNMASAELKDGIDFFICKMINRLVKVKCAAVKINTTINCETNLPEKCGLCMGGWSGEAAEVNKLF